MAQQNIIIGTADAKTGDTYFDAFTKVEANFNELFANLASQAQNITVVNSESDFPTQDATTITLEANKKTVIGASFSTSKTITPSSGSSLCSINPFSVQLTYTGTGNMFQSTNVSWELCNLGFSCTSGTIFSITGTSANTFLMADSVCISASTVGTFTGMNVVIQNAGVFGITGQGITTSGAINILSIIKLRQETSNSAHIALDLGTATFDNLEIINYEPDGPSGSTAISGLVNSGNINTNRVATIRDSTLNGGSMTPLSGITNSDVRFVFSGNAGVGDTIVDSLISINGNTTETVIAAASTPVKVAGTWTLQRESKITCDTTGRCTLDSERDVAVPIDTSLSIDVASGSNKSINLYLAKNGTVITDSKKNVKISAGSPVSAAILWQDNLSENDYIETFVENDTDTVNVIVTNGSLRIA